MARLPIPGSDSGTWGAILNEFLGVEHNPDGTLKASGSLASKANDTAVVHNTGTETIAGQKTFSSSPLVPTPTLGSHVANKTYTDTKATKPIVRQAYHTSGDITMTNTAGQWVAVSGMEISLPAAVGDWVELTSSLMFQATGSDYFDLAVIQGSTIKRRSSSGSTTVTAEGDTGIYPSPQSFRTSGCLFAFTVTADDLDSGNVRFALITIGTGGSKLFASTTYPTRWRAINLGPVS